MKKSITLTSVDGRLVTIPSRYKNLSAGRYWIRGFLNTFGEFTTGKYKISIATTIFKDAKKVTIPNLKELHNNDYNWLHIKNANQDLLKVPCKQALKIFFNGRIPEKFYIKVTKL